MIWLQHSSLFFYILVLLGGLVSLSISFLLYFKTKDRLLFFWSVFFSIYTLLLFSYLVVLSYINLNISDPNFYIILFLILLVFFLFALLMFTIPFFTHQLILNYQPKGISLLSGIFSIMTFIALCCSLEIDFVTKNVKQIPNWGSYGGLAYFALVLLYAIIYKFVYLKRISLDKRRFVVSTLILEIIFLPGFIVDIFLLKKFGIQLVNPLFYFIFSILFTLFITKHFFGKLKSISIKLDDRNLTAVYNLYQISGREREVIELILKGYNNYKIARMLFISLNTVKTHIRNIFIKMNVNSRFELLTRLMNQPKD